MLGASYSRNGEIAPMTSLRDATTAAATCRFSSAPLRKEFLTRLATDCGVNVIADHHTLSDRLPALSGPLSAIIVEGVKTYENVMRLEDGYLLARNVDWPELDLAEIDWPHPEWWIKLKDGGQSLTLRDIAVMASQRDDQLSQLALYRDRHVNLVNELIKAQRPRQTRELLCLLSRLPADRYDEARTERGVSLRTVPKEDLAAWRQAVREYAGSRFIDGWLTVSPGMLRAGTVALEIRVTPEPGKPSVLIAQIFGIT
jgi:hypothetical protein